jgi:hypothetical protein
MKKKRKSGPRNHERKEAVTNLSRRADDVPAHRQHFLWDGRIPVGHITVIAGGPAKGKSTLGYRIAADVGLPTIFVSTEEVKNTVWRPRLEASGVDMSKAWLHPEIQFGKGEEDTLARWVKEYGAKLVIVDPLANHIGPSLSNDKAIRAVIAPYVDLMAQLDFSIIFQVHVLRQVAKNATPLTAVPAGVVSLAKAVYLFAEDPTLGADENIRILACGEKCNFGRHPPSHAFEYETRRVPVTDPKTGETSLEEFALLISRGDSRVKARALLVTMRPVDKDRKSDLVAYELLRLLRDGPQPIAKLRAAINEFDPPVSWKTAERAAQEMGIIVTKDKQDARKLIWELPPSILDTLAEAGSDEVVIEGVEIDDPPDTFPEDWAGE